MKRSGTSARYQALWSLLAVALFAAVASWGVRIGGSLAPGSAPTPPPVAVATAAPHIATVYSNIGPPNPATLCAELSPMPKEVTVESTSGVIIATIQCRR
jgi:hypothetical protein